MLEQTRPVATAVACAEETGIPAEASGGQEETVAVARGDQIVGEAIDAKSHFDLWNVVKAYLFESIATP